MLTSPLLCDLRNIHTANMLEFNPRFVILEGTKRRKQMQLCEYVLLAIAAFIVGYILTCVASCIVRKQVCEERVRRSELYYRTIPL